MNITKIVQLIQRGQTALGIEFGSTQIKAVLISPDFQPLASGSFSWENRLQDGIWTYSEGDIFTGLRQSYAQLAAMVSSKYHDGYLRLCYYSLFSICFKERRPSTSW